MLKEIKKVREEILNWNTDINKLTFEDLFNATIEWFKHYQWDEDSKKMVELYSKLIDEEREETTQAWIDWDIIEVLDWIIDYVWVSLWFVYFGREEKIKEWVEVSTEEEFKKSAIRTMIMILWWTFTDWDLVKLAWLEVAYSNWTKPLEKRWEDDEEWKVGKVIKWKDFVKPDLKKVFEVLKKENK